VPTYRSLMIHYDPLQIDRDTLVAIVRRKTAAAVVDGLSRAPLAVGAKVGSEYVVRQPCAECVSLACGVPQNVGHSLSAPLNSISQS
jgi:hypothetical protein